MKYHPFHRQARKCLPPPLSFKYAAVNAQLGWIGKNGVLVTEKYGSRVRLSTMLIDFDFLIAAPESESKCPEECFECVAACPHKALKGLQWNMKVNRSEMIDFQLCNEKRSLYIKYHGRKHSCGLSIVSCPLGLQG